MTARSRGTSGPQRQKHWPFAAVALFGVAIPCSAHSADVSAIHPRWSCQRAADLKGYRGLEALSAADTFLQLATRLARRGLKQPAAAQHATALLKLAFVSCSIASAEAPVEAARWGERRDTTVRTALIPPGANEAELRHWLAGSIELTRRECQALARDSGFLPAVRGYCEPSAADERAPRVRDPMTVLRRQLSALRAGAQRGVSAEEGTLATLWRPLLLANSALQLAQRVADHPTEVFRDLVALDEAADRARLAGQMFRSYVTDAWTVTVVGGSEISGEGPPVANVALQGAAMQILEAQGAIARITRRFVGGQSMPPTSTPR